MAKSKPVVFEKSIEAWFPKGDQTAEGRVVIAVRVAKGQPGGGQFHGSTNYRSKATKPIA